MGSILASAAFALFFHWIGWRGLFILGSMPALLVFYVQARVGSRRCGWRGKKAQGAGRRARPPAAPANCGHFCLRFSSWCS